MNTITKSNQLAKDLCKDSVCRYVYGAKYQKHTTSLVKKLAKQYPGVYTNTYKKKTLSDADKGYMGIDCSGLVCKVLGIVQQGSSQLKSNAVKLLKVTKANAKEGMAIWKQGHIAYIGEGLKIYEANGVDKDMEVSSFDKRAKDFTYLLVVKGSYLAEHWNDKTTSKPVIKVSYYKKYTGKSLKIDVVFKAIGAPYGSVAKRKPVAKKNGYSSYKGSTTQNLKLIALAKLGKLKK